MLYEKQKHRSKGFFVLVCVEIFLLVFLVWELIYYYANTSADFWNVKFVDIANIIAQLATAGAFYLGFHQYHRSKRVERQAVLVAECKSVVVQMIVVIKEFRIGADTDFENIRHCCVRLGGLGSNFQELFSELDENVSKGIVRMHWQSMFFNELVYVMRELSLDGAVSRDDVRIERYLHALGMATNRVRDANTLKAFVKYSVYLDVLGSECMKKVREGFEFHHIFMFVLFFFDKKYTNEYMYGSISSLDVRARAPLIAAVKDACKFDFELID